MGSPGLLQQVLPWPKKPMQRGTGGDRVALTSSARSVGAMNTMNGESSAVRTILRVCGERGAVTRVWPSSGWDCGALGAKGYVSPLWGHELTGWTSGKGSLHPTVTARCVLGQGTPSLYPCLGNGSATPGLAGFFLREDKAGTVTASTQVMQSVAAPVHPPLPLLPTWGSMSKIATLSCWWILCTVSNLVPNMFPW